MEHLTIAMRCSQTGAPFFVVFSRDDQRRKFRITDAALGRTQGGPVLAKSGRTYTFVTKTWPADSFDWAGFFCPSCGHGRDGCGTYIRCGQCRMLVCAGTIRKLPSGISTFQCYPDCGGGGTLGGDADRGQVIDKLDAASLNEIGGVFHQVTRRLLTGRSS